MTLGKMQQIHFDGAKELEKIDLDIVTNNVRIYLDFMHIKSFSPGEKYKLHAHPNYEFHYVASGKGNIGLLDINHFWQNNELITKRGFSKSKNVPHLLEYYLNTLIEKDVENICVMCNIKQGDIFVNIPGQFHWQQTSVDEPITEYVFRCNFDINKEGETTVGLIDDYRMIQKLLLNSNLIVSHDEYLVRRNFESIFEEAYYRMPGYIVKINNILEELIICFARHYWDKKEITYDAPIRDHRKRKLQMIDEYISLNLQKFIPINELAQSVYMSPRSLSRFFKQETGSTAQNYILQTRLNKAIDLISNTNFKLSDIAEITGFSSQFHLSRVLKKLTGKNPSGYR